MALRRSVGAGIFLNLLVLPTVGIVLGSGTAGALLGLVTVRGAFLAVVPGRIILRGYEFLTVLLGRLSFCTWIGGKPEVWQIVGYYLVLAAAVWIYRAGVKKSENGEIFAAGKSGLYMQAWYALQFCWSVTDRMKISVSPVWMWDRETELWWK